MAKKTIKNQLAMVLLLWAVVSSVAAIVLVFTALDSEQIWSKLLGVSVRVFISFLFFVFTFSHLVAWMNTVLPWKTNPIKRALSILLMIFCFSSIAAVVMANFGKPDFINEEVAGRFAFIVCFFQALATHALLEGRYFLEKNQELELNLDRLEKEKLSGQLMALRQQIQPHFLFNCLNVLSELIHQDTEKADLFIQKFAKVYRYVLEINQHPLVQLKQELQFLEDYLFLQRIRFGDQLQVSRKLPSAILELHLPPLTLQLLIENAIKHNQITHDHPLNIELSYQKGQLQVINTIQLRNDLGTTTKLGLKNLKVKYELLGTAQPDFRIEDQRYVATIPLLKNAFV